jgi:lipopolysaccharide transport system ATP-binding protein
MTLMIETHDISKRYMRNMNAQPRYKTLRDGLTNAAKRLVGASPAQKEPDLREFWALKDVSFSISQGEVVGIIGRNGAGKSTLLKVLSRITAPTSGEARLHGRVGSLLEVGTGFHPELTGRENIFMNGVILGMGRQEILRKFDEIVAFSGVAEFIDTPVKWYSSGMYMRLAFSVAAHLDPEILIVDEVLAVGDAEFQKKCLGKMKNVSQEGRTVLFVSHNMHALRNFCSRVIHLEKGRIIADTPDVDLAIGAYLSQNDPRAGASWHNDGSLLTDDVVTPIRFALTDTSGQVLERPLGSDEPLAVHIEFDAKTISGNLAIGYALYDALGNLLYWSYQGDSTSFDYGTLKPGRNHIVSLIPPNLLNDGGYTAQLTIGLMGDRALLSRETSPVKIAFEITGNLRRASYWVDRRNTLIAPVLQWTTEEVKS